jgi:hypothetical protein
MCASVDIGENVMYFEVQSHQHATLHTGTNSCKYDLYHRPQPLAAKRRAKCDFAIVYISNHVPANMAGRRGYVVEMQSDEKDGGKEKEKRGNLIAIERLWRLVSHHVDDPF